MQMRSSQVPSGNLFSWCFIFFVSIWSLSKSVSSKLIPRDAYTYVEGDDSSEGEAHGEIIAPQGSMFAALDVGNGGEQIPAYWTQNPNYEKATHAFIMIHGKARDGDTYWTTMNDILNAALQNTTLGADPNSIIVAPQFFSTKYNYGQYTDSMLGWGDVNAWQAGDIATHPIGTKLTSFDALDALVDAFANSTVYPAMKNITVVGHGGGGQLNQRYSMVAKSSPPNVHIRYIHGDPSSCAHFTDDRPTAMTSGFNLPSKSQCQYFGTWRYGFQNFTGTATGLLSPQQYFQQYVSRDIISIVGLQDVEPDGDTTCMANMMGGTVRRDRNLAWWQYINLIAGTNENLHGFPATYDPLPDWSNISHNAIQLQLVVVQNADHNAAEVFGSSEGQSTLFATGKAPIGWRPSGWFENASSNSKKQSGSTQSSKSSASSLLSSNSFFLLITASASGLICLLQ